jgi:hypothetical protein
MGRGKERSRERSRERVGTHIGPESVGSHSSSETKGRNDWTGHAYLTVMASSNSCCSMSLAHHFPKLAEYF